MTAVRCTAPARGHVPGSQAQRQCPVHGDRSARMSSLPAPPAPEPASKHKQTVRPDGTVVEEWHKDGVLHREDGPAYVEHRPSGTVVERWHKDGIHHREDGPAYVERRPNGTVVEWWYRNGVLHREDGPAWVEHRRDGTVVERWRKDGKIHREDGPAWVEHRPNGTVVEWWYRNGELHRIDGPARVERDPDGTVTEAWYLDGTEVESWQVLGRCLTTRGASELSTEALRQIAKDVPWERWDELGSDHPLVRLWGAVHPTTDASAG